MHAADGAFVSLAELLHPQPLPDVVATSVPVAAPELPAEHADLAELARDVRLLRAQLADALDAIADLAGDRT